MSESFAREIAVGFLTYLGEQDLIDFTALEDPFDGTEPWPGVLGPVLPPSPDQIVVVTPGPQSLLRADVMQGIQIRLRGARSTTEAEADPRVVQDRAQGIVDALYPNGFPLVHVSMGTVRIGAVLNPQMLPVDPDPSGRSGIIINVTARLRRPRPPA